MSDRRDDIDRLDRGRSLVHLVRPITASQRQRTTDWRRSDYRHGHEQVNVVLP